MQTSSSELPLSTYYLITDADTHEKIMVGAVTKADIASEPTFDWYAKARQAYQSPDPLLIRALEESEDDLYFIIFGGTWCEDTQDIVPRFFKAQEISGFPEDKIVFFALDRFKKMAFTLPEAFHVTHTPTFIVMKGGKEAGRLVEYGKIGNWEVELAEIVKGGHD